MFTSSRCRRMVLAPLACASAIALLALGLAPVSSAQPTPTQSPATNRASKPDYSRYADSYHIPYAGRPLDWDHLTGMNVRVSINGGKPLNLQVDTGSVGVIVGEDDIPNMPTNGEPGSILYSSSGIELIGTWVPVTITFLDSDDGHGHKATCTIPVLAANKYVYHPGAVNSRPASRPATTTSKPHPRMMGMGFGRGKDPHQERNPFVNLTEMVNGTMRHGYTLTRDGITLGLTENGVGQGYVFEQLRERQPSTQMSQMRPGLRDWESSRGWVTVGGKDFPNAAMLYDTGLTNMMIGIPDAEQDQQEVPDGTPITVHMLSDQLQYSFSSKTATRPSEPTAPRRVTIIKRDAPSVNTGLRALANFDYLYDGDAGLLGLRPTR